MKCKSKEKMKNKWKDRADNDKNINHHYLEKRTMSCGVTVLAQLHKHTDKGHWGGFILEEGYLIS